MRYVMPNENQGESTPTTSPDDVIQNVKSEFNRKIENQNAQLSSVVSELQKLTQSLNSRQSPAPSESVKEVSVFDDEAAYTRNLEAKLEAKFERKVSEREQMQAKQQAVVNSIIADYPEANDIGSELYKRTMEIFGQFDESDRKSPLAMKAAVTSAAAEQGLKPKSKRRAVSENDDFSLSSTKSAPKGSKKSATEGISDATLEFARLTGLNVNDEKVLENLRKRSSKGNR